MLQLALQKSPAGFVGLLKRCIHAAGLCCGLLLKECDVSLAPSLKAAFEVLLPPGRPAQAGRELEQACQSRSCPGPQLPGQE